MPDAQPRRQRERGEREGGKGGAHSKLNAVWQAYLFTAAIKQELPTLTINKMNCPGWSPVMHSTGTVGG